MKNQNIFQISNVLQNELFKDYFILLCILVFYPHMSMCTIYVPSVCACQMSGTLELEFTHGCKPTYGTGTDSDFLSEQRML